MIASVLSVFGRTYWSLRMHFWLWRERRALVKLQSRSSMLIAERLFSEQSNPESPPVAEATFITKIAEQIRLQPLVFGDGKNFIKAISGESPLDEEPFRCAVAKKSLLKQKAELVAEYDAHFLSSIRIKSPVQRSSR